MSYAYLRLLRIKDEWWQRANNRLTWSPGYAKTEDPRRTVAMEHARISGLPSNRSSKAGILPSMNCTYLLPPIGSSQTRAVLARPIQYHQNLYGLSHRAPAPIPKNAIAHTNGTSLIPPNQNISCKICTQNTYNHISRTPSPIPYRNVKARTGEHSSSRTSKWAIIRFIRWQVTRYKFI